MGRGILNLYPEGLNIDCYPVPLFLNMIGLNRNYQPHTSHIFLCNIYLRKIFRSRKKIIHSFKKYLNLYLIFIFNKERKIFICILFIKFNKNKKYKSQFSLTKVLKLCCKIKNIYAHSKFHYKK